MPEKRSRTQTNLLFCLLIVVGIASLILIWCYYSEKLHQIDDRIKAIERPTPIKLPNSGF